MKPNSMGFKVFYNDSKVGVCNLKKLIKAPVEFTHIQSSLKPILKDYETIALGNDNIIICDYKKIWIKPLK